MKRLFVKKETTAAAEDLGDDLNMAKVGTLVADDDKETKSGPKTSASRTKELNKIESGMDKSAVTVNIYKKKSSGRSGR